MPPQNGGATGQRSERASGLLLLAGAGTFILVMMHHPTGHAMMSAENFGRMARLNVFIHGLALAAIPILFLGLLGLTRRLGSTDLATAALVLFGFAGVAVMSSAVASGLVATRIMDDMQSADEGSRAVAHALLDYSGQVNHGYTSVYVVASSAAILLWSAAILKGRAMSRAAGAAGILVGAGVAVAFLSGHVGLGVHGFGMIAFAQSAWLVWIGLLLCLEGGAPRAT